MSNSHRGLSIDASYHVSVHLTKLFQSRRFLEIDQSETRIACCSHILLMDRDKMSNVYREPSIDASYQISEDKNFKNQPIRNKSHLWWPCLLTDRDEMGNLYRGPLKNQPIRNKNCMWWPCLITDRDKMSNLHRGHSIDDSYQVPVVAMFDNRSG